MIACREIAQDDSLGHVTRIAKVAVASRCGWRKGKWEKEGAGSPRSLLSHGMRQTRFGKEGTLEDELPTSNPVQQQEREASRGECNEWWTTDGWLLRAHQDDAMENGGGNKTSTSVGRKDCADQSDDRADRRGRSIDILVRYQSHPSELMEPVGFRQFDSNMTCKQTTNHNSGLHHL